MLKTMDFRWREIFMKLGMAVLFSGLFLVAQPAAAQSMCSAVFKSEQKDAFEIFRDTIIVPSARLYRKHFDWMVSPSGVAARGQPFKTRMLEIAGRLPRKMAVVVAPVMPLPKYDRVERIFDRVWKNPETVLTAKDKAVLGEARVIENVEIMRDLSRRHPFVRFVGKWNGRMTLGSMLFAQLLLMNHGAQVLEGGVLDLDELRARKGLDLLPNQVRIINENSYWPRSALQIGETVYFYRDKRLTAAPVSEFLKFDPKEVAVLDRSVQMFTLNFPLKDVQELQVFLERRRGGQSVQKWVNDGMTKVAEILGRHLPSESFAPYHLIDSSASFSGMYFSLLKRAGLEIEGRPLVGAVMQVDLGAKGNKTINFTRNLWLNTIETGIIIRSAAYHFVVRNGLELATDKVAVMKEDVARAVESWRERDILAKLDDLAQLQTELKFQKEALKAATDPFDILSIELKIEILERAAKDLSRPS